MYVCGGQPVRATAPILSGGWGGEDRRGTPPPPAPPVRPQCSMADGHTNRRRLGAYGVRRQVHSAARLSNHAAVHCDLACQHQIVGGSSGAHAGPGKRLQGERVKLAHLGGWARASQADTTAPSMAAPCQGILPGGDTWGAEPHAQPSTKKVIAMSMPGWVFIPCSGGWDLGDRRRGAGELAAMVRSVAWRFGARHRRQSLVWNRGPAPP